MRKTWSLIFLGQSSNSSLAYGVAGADWPKSTSKRKSREIKFATALALTALVVRLTFVAADFARVAQW